MLGAVALGGRSRHRGDGDHVDLEFQQLDRRYEALRRASPDREKRVLASLIRVGQQAPVVVVAAEQASDRFVLLDGYKRVRALIRLRVDTVRATPWALSELEALLLERLIRTNSEDGPLEQGWLLRELRDRFGLTAEELAHRFDKSRSWISRRLALVADLPEFIQAQVRRGEIAAHAAMKFLVPVARANAQDCLRLAQAIGPLRPTTRQVEALAAAFVTGSEKTRELVLSDPQLFLRAREATMSPTLDKDPAALLLADFGALAGVARRAHRRLKEGVGARLTPPEHDEIHSCFRQAQADTEQLFARWKREVQSDRSDNKDSDPQVA